MIKNAIKMRMDIEMLLDRTRSPRFDDIKYFEAVNMSIEAIINDRTDAIKQPGKRYSFEAVQRVIDELYTVVVKDAVVVPTGNNIAIPANYHTLAYVKAVIDGVTETSFPISHGELAVIDDNPFKKPSNTKVYHVINSSGIQIQRATTGTFSSALLTYIKNPAVVGIGTLANKINAGTALAIGTTYYVDADSVHAGATYYEGETFIATTTVLTTGTVIPAANITNCDLPGRLHNEVVRLSAAILNGTVSNYPGKQMLEIDAQKS